MTGLAGAPGLMTVLVTCKRVLSGMVWLVWLGSSGALLAQQTRPVIVTVSMRHPTAALPLSVPHRQRSCTFWPAAEGGRVTVVVMNPPELPLQHDRLMSGLKKPGSIIVLEPP